MPEPDTTCCRRGSTRDHSRRHGSSGPQRLRRRCDRSRRGAEAGDRRDQPRPLPHARGTVQWRSHAGARAREQPALQCVARVAASPLPQLARRVAAATGAVGPRRRSAPPPRTVAATGAVRYAGAPDAVRRAGAAAAACGKRRSIWPPPCACSRTRASTARRCTRPGSRRGRPLHRRSPQLFRRLLRLWASAMRTRHCRAGPRSP